MPQGLTNACLPASRVTVACQLALDRIDAECDALKSSLIYTQRLTRTWKVWGKSDEKVWEQAPAEIKKIVELYRAKDVRVLTAISALARAVFEANPEFTVEVTADDFRLFSHWFKPLTKREVL